MLLINAVETAGENEVGVVRIDRDRANGNVFEAGVAPLPRLAVIVGNGDDAAAPQSPARRPEPAVAIDDEVVDDVARERDAVARIRPRLRAVGRHVDLAAARAEEEEVGIGGIGDESADVGAEESGAPPLRRRRNGQDDETEKNEEFTHSRPWRYLYYSPPKQVL